MKLFKYTHLKKILILTQLYLLTVTHATEPEKIWETMGFDAPESALYDTGHNVFYVSNINGSPLELNGKGYISRLSPTGKIIDLKWVTGLDAPKGLAIYENHLYVADMQKLHIIDTNSGHIENSIYVPASKMLNDIAVDQSGAVYVTDMLGGGVFKWKNNQMTKWLSAETFPHPNGIFIKGKNLLLATWGKGIQNDFTTDILGGVYQVELTDKVVTPVAAAQQIGNLDGLTNINQQLIVNDWINGNVFTVGEQGVELLFTAPKTAADISANGNLLIVPVMGQNKVTAYSINQSN